MSKGKFMLQLAFAKKTNQYFRKFLHSVEDNVDGSSVFVLRDGEGETILRIQFDFYPDDIVVAECEEGDFGALETLLVFSLLDCLGEKALVRFIDTKFFYSEGEFFVVQDGPRPIIYKVSSDKESLLEVENYHIPRELLAQKSHLDFM